MQRCLESQIALHRLVRGLDPERVILYGSSAKGLMRPESDIDLLLLVDQGVDAAILLHRARQLVARSFPPVDLSVCTPDQVEEAYAGRSPFLLSILERGITIYRRPGRPAGVPKTMPPDRLL